MKGYVWAWVLIQSSSALVLFHNLGVLTDKRYFNSCYCKYHQEIVEIKVKFNNMCASVVHHGLQNSIYKCACFSLCANPINGNFGLATITCQATSHTFAKIFNLWGRPYAPKFQAKNGLLVWSVLRAIVQNVAFIFYHFVIGHFHGIVYTKGITI
jgi:hypothetical protein